LFSLLEQGLSFTQRLYGFHSMRGISRHEAD
jgi:hypothetical protein